jgi:hypothetical protein
MEKNKLLEQTETGAADRGDLVKRKMFKHMLQREFSDIPGGYGLPMKEAKEKVKKLESQQEAREAKDQVKRETRGMKHGGMVKSSASKRADGIAKKGKTRGKMV